MSKCWHANQGIYDAERTDGVFIYERGQIIGIRHDADLERIDWLFISTMSNTLSEGFIRMYQDRLNWYWISGEQNLSPDFMREFKDSINWTELCKWKRGNLTESLVRELGDKVGWGNLIRYGVTDEQFERNLSINLDSRSYLRGN